jgi:hypothetical protein
MRGLCSFNKKDRFSGGLNPYWWSKGLTFWAPFDRVDDPLKLHRGVGALSFTRATEATFLNPDTGLIEVADAGQLRIEAQGALIEGQRTNLCLQSAALGTTWSPTGITVGDNDAASPDGGTNAELLTASAGNGTLIQDLGVIASAAKVFSIYLKRKTGTGNIDLTLNGGTGWTTVAVTASWARYQITATLADPDVGIRVVTSGDAVWAWGGQVEAAAFSSSYIPTTTAAVTRNADRLSTSSLNYSETNGSTYVEADTGDSSNNGRVVASTVPNANMFIWFGQSATIQINDGTTGLGTVVYAARTTYKIASRWAAVGLGISVDGAGVETSVYDGSFGGGDLHIGGNQVVLPGNYEIYGHIKNLRIWNRALSDAEMIAITS